MDIEISMENQGGLNVYSSVIGGISVPVPSPGSHFSSSSSCKLKGIRKRSVQFADADDIVDDSVLFNEIENTDMEINRLGEDQCNEDNNNHILRINNKKGNKGNGIVKGSHHKLNRRPKISPLRKELDKAKLLQSCLERTKKNRHTLISRIRQGEATSGQIAREILNDEMYICSDDIDKDCHDLTTGQVDEGYTSSISTTGNECTSSLSLSSSKMSPSILDDDNVARNNEKYIDLLADIYESICQEISEELNSICDEYESDTDWGQLADEEFRTIPDENLILCPFCRVNFMGTDFELCTCNCINY